MRGASFPQSGAVPENGQITKIEVRGYYVEGCENKEEEGHFCERHIHFQDLRKLPNGELEVISTTQAFTLPKKEEHGENGSHLTATQKSGTELNMRMTLQPTG